MRPRGGTDFFSGLIFLGLGLSTAACSAMDYGLGTPMHMGPGFFPFCIGTALTVIGSIVLLAALAFDGPPLPDFQLKPTLLVLAATLLFGFTLASAGLILSVVLCVLVGAYAGREFRLKEALFLGLILAATSVLIFVVGLRQLFPIWPKWPF